MPAAAATIVHVSSFTSPSGYKTGTIHNDAPNGIGPSHVTDLNVEVTPFNLHIDSPTSFDIVTYCIDIADYLYTPSNYSLDTVAALPAVAAKQSALLNLLTHTLANPGNASLAQSNTAIGAGVQLAIWEILNEVNATWDIASGTFRAGGGSLGNINTSGDALNYARTYLQNVSTGGIWNTPVGNYELRVLSGTVASPANQNQVFLVAVPEPAVWAMMISGFGLIGGAMRRRSRAALQPA